jgi:lysophospholipase L1-like esterase
MPLPDHTSFKKGKTMTMLGTGLVAMAALAAGAEGIARIFYRLTYLSPYTPRVIGEYPYKAFIQEREMPLACCHRKGFRSPRVTINRFGLRGPEPSPDGAKKRFLVMGESDYFGAKLPDEKDLWSIRLNQILADRGLKEWEVLNGGSAVYNAVQHRLFWEQELHRALPEILLIRIGANDISQAWVMGSRWRPGAPWPMEFIHKLERRRSPWQEIAEKSCAYHLLKRSSGPQKADAFRCMDNKFRWEDCLSSILDNHRLLVANAVLNGVKVAFLCGAPAYDLHMSPEDQKRIAALQANWRFFVEGWAKYQFIMMDNVKELAKALGIPFLDPRETIHSHPRRFQLYCDLGHFNAEGHRRIAEFLYKEMEKLGWWH